MSAGEVQKEVTSRVDVVVAGGPEAKECACAGRVWSLFQ